MKDNWLPLILTALYFVMYNIDRIVETTTFVANLF